MIAKVALGNAVFCGVFTGDKQFVEVSGAVGTGFDTLAATGAQGIFIQDQTIRALVGSPAAVTDRLAVGSCELPPILGILRAFLDTRRNFVLLVALAMVAESGQKVLFRIGKRAGYFLVYGRTKSA